MIDGVAQRIKSPCYSFVLLEKEILMLNSILVTDRTGHFRYLKRKIDLLHHASTKERQRSRLYFYREHFDISTSTNYLLYLKAYREKERNNFDQVIRISALFKYGNLIVPKLSGSRLDIPVNFLLLRDTRPFFLIFEFRKHHLVFVLLLKQI